MRLKKESELPALTAEQLEVLRRFAMFEASLEELRSALAGVWEIDFASTPMPPDKSATMRTAITGFRVPEPGIIITREHISNALERKRFELITERDLVVWATVLLLNDAYALDPQDEDLIADWLNDISISLAVDEHHRTSSRERYNPL
ncbi:MAG TPA: hypothetical protein VME23_16310 [Terracidiphilus sp.]|nr:hypothetical protein [Terracidiphilus sp.]